MDDVRKGSGIRPGKYIILAVAVVVVIVTSVTWWLWPTSEEEEFTLPAKVCRGAFSGRALDSLFEKETGKLRTHIYRDFPDSPGEHPVCELSADVNKVAFRVEKRSEGGESREELKAEYKHVGELGPAHGAYSRSSGTISLYIPCPAEEKPHLEIFVNVGFNAAQIDDVHAKGAKKAVRKLARLTGYTARTLAHKYQCEGADELPDGPVQLRAGDGKL
ncbi:hypothetical protein [Streptomyces cacaoi]|uniref:hypothetical protein n=1 Tax=Streptomyces cacaoi TaxID=1898 RepID=UPI00260E30DF|nr:hypothetical protein [Streptomyces cacaoi]